MPENSKDYEAPAGHCHRCVMEIVSLVIWQWILAFWGKIDLTMDFFSDEFSLRAFCVSETVPKSFLELLFMLVYAVLQLLDSYLIFNEYLFYIKLIYINTADDTYFLPKLKICVICWIDKLNKRMTEAECIVSTEDKCSVSEQNALQWLMTSKAYNGQLEPTQRALPVWEWPCYITSSLFKVTVPTQGYSVFVPGTDGASSCWNQLIKQLLCKLF